MMTHKTTSPSEFDQMAYYRALVLEDLQKGMTFYGTRQELEDLQERLISYLCAEDDITFEYKGDNHLEVKYELNARVSANKYHHAV